MKNVGFELSAGEEGLQRYASYAGARTEYAKQVSLPGSGHVACIHEYTLHKLPRKSWRSLVARGAKQWMLKAGCDDVPVVIVVNIHLSEYQSLANVVYRPVRYTPGH